MKLWEYDPDERPCPFADDVQPFDSWEAMRKNADRYDTSLNVVIWWYWWPPDEDSPFDRLTLYVAMPNRERVYPWEAPVSRDEEPAIREWLRGRLGRLIGYWQVPPPGDTEAL